MTSKKSKETDHNAVQAPPALANGSLEVITTHINADFDAVASMIAAGKLYPNALMVFPGSQEKNLRNFFIQSMIYLFNVAKVKDVDMEKVKRLILVDTRQPGRIGPLEKILSNEDLSIHIYDHHPGTPEDLKGEYEVIHQVGANATLMTEILKEQGVELTPEEATVLALGIYEDTGSFTFRSTTTRDFMAAAELLNQGADLNTVSEMLTRELTVNQVDLLNELIKSAKTHIINGVEVVITEAITSEYIDEMAVLVHKMMDIQNLQVLFAVVEMDGRVYMVCRSRLPTVNVGEIAQAMGGGGHESAAAATIKMTLPQAIITLNRVLNQYLGPTRTARTVMSYPVISVTPDSSLKDARKMLVRYDINVLLIVDETQNIKGFISMQNVEKALLHGLTSYPVRDLMTTEFEVVGPDATFQEIQSVIVEQKQRILPVAENGKPIGVITRTDLLNILASETNMPGSAISETADQAIGRTKKILNLLNERLPKPIVNLLADLGRTADSLEYNAFAVGGFVRDLILRLNNLDIDVVVEGDAIRFAEVFAKTRPEVRVRQHRKFNTAVLIFPDDFKIDVTTARMEYYESPAALPVVESSSLRLDLYRRDFTINTLAVSLNSKGFGTVIDYFRGLKDIKDGYIRVLHNLSFVDDPTRVFRAIRFEQRFGFKIGKLTTNLIQNAVKNDFFSRLSGKRLSGEIRMILQEEDPGPAAARMAEFDLLKFIQPGIVYDRRTSDVFRRIKKVRDWFDLTYISEPYEAWLIYLMGLLDGLGRMEMSGLCKRLALRKHEIKVLVEEKPQADMAMKWLHRKKNIRPSEIYKLLSTLSNESVLFMMAKTTKDEATRAMADFFTRLRRLKTDISGKDLIDMGLSPGPDFKTILDGLLEARINGIVNNREEELEFIHRFYLTPNPLERERDDS